MFHEIRFPVSLSLASASGVERRTEIVTLANGFEERNTPWAQARRRYDAGIGLRSLDDLETVLGFFEARRGRLYGFRWRDWLDHGSASPSTTPGPFDQSLGTGDGNTVVYQLVKRYGSAPEVVRPILKPVYASLRVAVAGFELSAGSDFGVDTATGLVTLTSAPAPGEAVTAGFEFDTPVRFDTDVLEINLAAFEAGEIPSIPVVEVRL
ncbi:MAG: DUF2460 domain-containing protein [Pseudomonadota bacterium]